MIITLRRLFFIVLLFTVIFACHCQAESDMITVHFLDVGQGDAAIIQCGGQTLMIDGGDRNCSQLIYSYLKELGITFIDYIISTHPHDDHVYGLSTALVVCDVGIVYSPVTGYDGKGFTAFQEKLSMRGAEITVPHRGDSFSLGRATVTFLSEPQNWWSLNDQSLIAKVEFDEVSFLFTGDAEWIAEQDLLNSGMDLSADILKIGHHGAPTSTSKEFVDAVNPTYAIISVGENNAFGHPAAETIMMLQRSLINVFRTDIHGTIICTSNGKSIGFQMTKKKQPVITPMMEPESNHVDNHISGYSFDSDESDIQNNENEIQYIGNRNSHVFHYLDCASVQDMKEKNKVVFYSRDEAIDLGYKPCGRCNP